MADSYMCFPLSEIDKSHLEAGHNIIMPVSALGTCQKLLCRMTFRIAKSNDDTSTSLHYHCGVAGFTADEGFVFLPTWMMKKLKIRDGELVNVKSTTCSLPEGNYIKVQPHATKFVTSLSEDPKLVLKKAFRDNVACLTTGDNIVVTHDDNKYLIHIAETKPSRVISLHENDDYEVEFAIPLDYYRQRPCWPDHRVPGQWSGALLQGYDTIYQSMKKLTIKESTIANKQHSDRCKPFTGGKMANVYIPDDIIQYILARLPRKPLLRSRCVSTHWNSLVSDPYFMKTISRRKILLVAPEFYTIEVNGPCGDDDMVRFLYPFECRTDGGVRNIRVIGTFNGIVALVVNDHKEQPSKSVNFTSHIVLYNPFTGASEIIPDPYSPFYDDSRYSYGFGYGATKDELKIVRFRKITGRKDYCYNCDVFNLKERSWSTTEILIKDTDFWSSVGTFLNGSLYWVSDDKIVALDVNTMVISKIHRPCERIESESHLFTLHGCLSLITRHTIMNSHSNNFNMWVMTKTEQGVKNSWSKSRLLTLDYPMADEVITRGRVQILNLMDDGRILIKGAKKELMIYDTSKDSYKFLKPSPSRMDYFNYAIEYQESLISPSIIV